MNFRSEINILLNNKQKILLCLSIFGAILVSLFEVVGIGSIGGFVLLISDIDNAISKIPDSIFIKEYLLKLDTFLLMTLCSILLCLIFLIKNILIILYNYFELSLRRNIVYSISTRVYKNYLNADYLFHQNINSSILINNIISKSSRTANYIFGFILIIKEILLLVFLLTAIFLINFKMTIMVFLLMLSVSILIYLSVKKALTLIGDKTLLLEAESLKSLNQGLGGFKVIKILGRIKFFINEFSKIQSSKLGLQVKHRIFSMLPRFILEVLSITTISLITFFLISNKTSFELILPVITFLSLAIVRMVPAFVSLNIGFQNLKFSRAASKETVLEILKLENNFLKNNSVNHQIIIKEFNSITLEKISFKYEKSKKILNKVDLNFQKGDFIGITGKTGGGKSTLIDIILGLLKPTEGKIFIDDKQIEDNFSDINKNIGYVPQEVFLSDESILNNIAYGISKNEIDMKKIENCLDKSQLRDFVDSQAEKINTNVGDKGVRISGGQKQRIGIARALYDDPSIIILDESTSSLDNATEQKIIEDVKKLSKNKIVIFVTHRISSLKFCNKIYELKDGNCELKGNFEKFKNLI
jgi:ATP-binding cassette, subfamily B, bacterial PglK